MVALIFKKNLQQFIEISRYIYNNKVLLGSKVTNKVVPIDMLQAIYATIAADTSAY